jgi:hypothetical protein
MLSCNSLNVRKPTPLNQTFKTLVKVPYNTHYRTLTNLQSEKMGSQIVRKD